jgi:uncharacterized membrane protein
VTSGRTSLRDRAVDLVQWMVVGIIAAAAVVLPLSGTSATFVVLLLSIPFAAIHGVRRYGWRLFVAFFVVTVLVSNAFENLSVLTGFPFGDYYWTGDPKLFNVPILIGPVYFGLGYLSWVITSTILDRAHEYLDVRRRVGRINTVVLPTLSAALMTMVDLGSDSRASTVARAWIWEEGGGVFGVPYTNYLGWWLVGYVFFPVFTLILARVQTTNATGPRLIVTPANLLQPAIIYGLLGLASVPYFFSASRGTAVDGAGVSWDITAINETMMTINIFTVLVIAFLAIAKILRGDAQAPRNELAE